MDMSSWKNIIIANGGYEKIVCLYFDNGRTWRRPVIDGFKFNDEVTLDETNQAWIIRKSMQGCTANGHSVVVRSVEDNADLTNITFVEDVNDINYFDKTY